MPKTLACKTLNSCLKLNFQTFYIKKKSSQALPKPGELRIAKSISDLKLAYSTCIGMRRIFSQVLATGNRE